MNEQTKCLSVNLPLSKVKELKSIKKQTGKSQNEFLTESILAVIEKFKQADKKKKKLYFVKNRLFIEKMNDLMKKTQNGEVPDPADHSTIYCSATDPGVGYSIFDVESKEKLSEILTALEPYSETYEITQVLTLEEFQAKMQQMTV